MNNPFFISTFFLNNRHRFLQGSPLEERVFLLLKKLDFEAQDLVEECSWRPSINAEEKSVSNWKELLKINLLFFLAKKNSPSLSEKICSFENQPWNHSSQLLRLMLTVNQLLANQRVSDPEISLLDGGAALIQLKEFESWRALPYHPQHLELGIYLGLYGLLSRSKEVESTLCHLANWQLNALDSTGKPIKSLFAREDDAAEKDLSLLYYLFFLGVAKVTANSKFASVCQALQPELSRVLSECEGPIDPFYVLIEQFFGDFQLSELALDLPCQIYDTSTSLVGYRSKDATALCTLHGGHTGLGYLRFEDLEILNYGPQYYPLDDCRGFGIEGNFYSDHGIRKSIVEWNRTGFSLKGCVRFVDQPNFAVSQPGFFDKYRGIWIDVDQEYQKGRFKLGAKFLSLDGWENTSFSFFVRADFCELKDGSILKPQTLKRYEGKWIDFCFKTQLASIEISPSVKEGILKIIPLSGQKNFWEASFLVSYEMVPTQSHYQWTITNQISKIDEDQPIALKR